MHYFKYNFKINFLYLVNNNTSFHIINITYILLNIYKFSNKGNI